MRRGHGGNVERRTLSKRTKAHRIVTGAGQTEPKKPTSRVWAHMNLRAKRQFLYQHRGFMRWLAS